MDQGWEVAWSYPGLWALRQLPWRDAADVDAAVQLFATSGEGHVERVRGAPTGLWLKVPPHVARLSIDKTTRTITVWWVCRAWW
jgi:hypothetical protein